VNKYTEHPLGDALVRAGQSIPVADSESYRITGIFSFGKGFIKRDTIQGSETTYKSLTPLRTGQLVMSKLNAWEGAISVVTSDFDGSYVSPEYPVFDINQESAHVDYIRYLTSWSTLWERLVPRGSMVRRKRTTPETLLTTVVPIPDRDEQRRIVGKLDALLGRVDAVQELRTSFSCLQGNLHESLVSRIAGKAIETVQLGDLLALERTPIAIDPEAPYRVIGMKSFGKGIIHYPPTLGSDVSKLSYFKLPADALLLSNIKAWEGAISVSTGIVARDYVASNRFLNYMPRDERVNSSYLRHYFLSRRGLAQISAASPGGADRNRTLGRKRFEALEIPLPPRAEQDRVARILDSFAERVSKVYADPALDALRPSILNAAFTGQL
jgi:type I restriction enzyme S subunit